MASRSLPFFLMLWKLITSSLRCFGFCGLFLGVLGEDAMAGLSLIQLLANEGSVSGSVLVLDLVCSDMSERLSSAEGAVEMFD